MTCQIRAARPELPAIIVYLVTLLTVLGVSLAFNLAPVSSFKKVMARLDQAAIFLFIAGTYTPFLAILGGTRDGQLGSCLLDHLRGDLLHGSLAQGRPCDGGARRAEGEGGYDRDDDEMGGTWLHGHTLGPRRSARHPRLAQPSPASR